jgi:hypothetical protein
MKGFTSTIQDYQMLHGGVTVQAYVRTLMRKYVDGELLAEDGNCWVNSTQQRVTNPGQVKEAISAMITKIGEAIPEQEAKNGSMWVSYKAIQIDLTSPNIAQN